MKLRFPTGDTHFRDSDWQTYQLLQYSELVRWAPRRTLALDCGAHAGIMTRRFARDFDSVIAFEPVHHQLLSLNTQDFASVRVIDSAVSNQSGFTTISINRENSGDNRIGEGELEITTVRIDGLNLSPVGAIKMDIQGSELWALQGAEQTIVRDHPSLMLEIESDDPNRAEIESLMNLWNYSVVYRKNADRVYSWRGWL